ncbi:MAG: hypothetical protein WBP59_03585 [Ilumatobacteraceae bacterium]
MGGRRSSHSGVTRRRLLVGSVAVVALGVAACDSESDPSGVVQPADAVTAIVMWQAAEQTPTVDDNGEPKLPVIYVVAGDGTTVDVGIQAAVAESTVDDAVVRFADDVSEGFDADADGSPVHDDGVMLAIGAMPDPARTVTVDIARFDAQDEHEQLTLEVSAAAVPNDDVQPAAVTSVERR